MKLKLKIRKINVILLGETKPKNIRVRGFNSGINYDTYLDEDYKPLNVIKISEDTFQEIEVTEIKELKETLKLVDL